MGHDAFFFFFTGVFSIRVLDRRGDHTFVLYRSRSAASRSDIITALCPSLIETQIPTCLRTGLFSF